MKIVKMVDFKNDVQVKEKVAELYCWVFQEEPWNENNVPSKVMEVMDEQFKRPNATALAGFGDGELIGFTWMYQILKDDLKEGTRYSPELSFLFDGQKNVFYLQEIAVKKEFRRQGNGEILTRELLFSGRKNGADIVVLSTHAEAKSIVLLISKLGFQNSGVIRPPAELGRTYWTLKLEN